jgi:hypothetical protein
MAKSSDPTLGRHSSTNANSPRSVADLHTVEIESLAVVTTDLPVASTIVKRFNDSSDLSQLAIVP